MAQCIWCICLLYTAVKLYVNGSVDVFVYWHYSADKVYMMVLLDNS